MKSPRILADETQIAGQWVVEQGQTKLNADAQRIEVLVDGYLKEVAVAKDGWSKLYSDPVDGRLWELTYPESADHGGGAPHLKQVTPSDAERRYKI